jgi:hypothetical protein
MARRQADARASQCAISPRALREPDEQPDVVKKATIQGCARTQRSEGETHMDNTTLLIIILLVLLLAGGGWYGRGRWY